MRISYSCTHQIPCASICDHPNEFKQLPSLRSRLLPPSKHIDANGSRKAVEKRTGRHTLSAAYQRRTPGDRSSKLTSMERGENSHERVCKNEKDREFRIIDA